MRPSSRTVADRQTRPLTRLLLGTLTWIIVLIFFFPVLWMALTGLKREQDADTPAPHFIFTPTLDQYKSVWKGAGGLNGLPPYLIHSVTITVLSTRAVLLLSSPGRPPTLCPYARSSSGGTCCSSSSPPRCSP
jgi:sorbitol/mannitol transport system permease protein